MGRLLGPKCRLCRREGMKLFLKGARCDSPQCAIVRRESPPGMHGWRRGKFSDYGQRIREKQRVKRFYGILERQFRRYFELASRGTTNTGEELLKIVESRVDNVIYRLGFAISRGQARQMIGHGHVYVNGKKHTIPSRLVKVNDVITPAPKTKSQDIAKNNREASKGRIIPSWLKLEEAELRGVVMGLPGIGEIKEALPVKEQLIVEICSR